MPRRRPIFHRDMAYQDGGLLFREDEPGCMVGQPADVFGSVAEERSLSSDQAAVKVATYRLDKGKNDAFGRVWLKKFELRRSHKAAGKKPAPRLRRELPLGEKPEPEQ